MTSVCDITFTTADESHDAGIRRLLREAPMGGAVSISLRREPDYFASVEAEGGGHREVAALDEYGRVVCFGSVLIRNRFWNGRCRRIGYLGQLRLAASHAGRFDVVRRGYKFFSDLLPELGIDLCFSSIAQDNLRARGFLERGLPGMPRYLFLGELVTLLIPVAPKNRRVTPSPGARREANRSGGSPRSGSRPIPPLLPVYREGGMQTLIKNNRAFQLAPAWEDFDHNGGVEVVSDAAGPIACGGLWDQRPFKQTVVTGYSSGLSIVRPAYNLIARALGGFTLPKPQTVLPQAFVSHLASPPDQPGPLIELISRLCRKARSRGIEIVTLGLDVRDPRLPALVRRFRPRQYHTRLCTVGWPGAPPIDPPDGRLLFPEVSTL